MLVWKRHKKRKTEIEWQESLVKLDGLAEGHPQQTGLTLYIPYVSVLNPKWDP